MIPESIDTWQMPEPGTPGTHPYPCPLQARATLSGHKALRRMRQPTFVFLWACPLCKSPLLSLSHEISGRSRWGR